MTDPPLSKLTLDETDLRLHTSIGGVDITNAVSDGSIRTALDSPPAADMRLDAELLAGRPVDYFGRVEIRGGGVRPNLSFSGHALRATPADDGLHVECQTRPSLTDTKMNTLMTLNCDPRELVFLMARTGGLPEGQIQIHEMDTLPLEVIEILIPLHGVSVSEPVRLGALTLLNPDCTEPVTDVFEDGYMRDEVRDADCHALYRRVARHLLPVEEEAVAAVDVLLAWLTTRARYGLALLPDMTPQTFSRVRALSRPQRSDIIVARGLDTRRTWMRDASPVQSGETVPLGESSRDWLPPDPDALTTAHKLGLLALRRATTVQEILQRINALWEAIEYYVATVRVEPRFCKAQARRVREAVPTDIDSDLHKRVVTLLGNIENPPLMAKLREAARRHGVPLTEEEMSLLARIRKVRNDTSHGSAAVIPPAEDVDYATSVVARLFLHALHHVGSG